MAFAPLLKAQETVEDIVSIDEGYSSQTFYRLSNGNKTSVPEDDWDIAFEQDGQTGAIRINSANQVQLITVPNATITDWENLSITNEEVDDLTKMYNSSSKWFYGAFNANNVTTEPFDLGWGVYNIVTHNVIGDSLHVLKLPGNNYRKVWIESLIDRVWTFHHANLDGSDELTVTINQDDFPDKNFVYYSFADNAIIDREPHTGLWDLLFTRYSTLVVQDTVSLRYPVTGVLGNVNTQLIKAQGVDTETVDYADYTFGDDISTIGWDWKEFNTSVGQYMIEEDLAFFAMTQYGEIYKLIFTGFGGSETGNFLFTKQLITVTAVSDLQTPSLGSLAVQPNLATAQTNITILYNINENSNLQNANIQVYNVSGQLVHQAAVSPLAGFRQHQLAANTLSKGMYIVQLNLDGYQATQKLIVH